MMVTSSSIVDGDDARSGATAPTSPESTNSGNRAMVRIDHARPSHEVVLVREGAGGGPRSDAQLGVDVLQVPSDGVLAEDERRRDLAVAATGGDEAEDLPLPGAQP